MNRLTVSHETPMGTMWSTWTPSGLYRLDWNRPDDHPITEALEVPSHVREFGDALSTYLQGGSDEFDGIAIDPSGWTEFTRHVYENCRTVRAGSTITYQQLAVMSGSPKASRAVGGAMARNRILLVIPCHRVIASSGALTGFSAGGGLETKRRLLELERSAESKIVARR